MLDVVREQLTTRIRNAEKMSGLPADAAETVKKNYRELSYRLMLLTEAEKVQKKVDGLISRHDAQAYSACIVFYKNAVNTDGPGERESRFCDSVKRVDQENPEQMNILLSAFRNITPQAIKTDEAYREKITDLLEKICNYVLYHREKYAPTASVKQ